MTQLQPTPENFIDPSEHILNDDEIANLACVSEARKRAEKFIVHGIIMSSEKITHHDYFGYVFRYDTLERVQVCKYERTEHGLKEVGKTDELRELHGIVTLWTHDGTKFNHSFLSDNSWSGYKVVAREFV